MRIFKPYYNNNYTFYAKQNFTESCPHCGVPACGKEDVLWYSKDEQKIAIVFDGSLLDLEIEIYLKQNITKENYSELPQFIKSWNEAKGWSENWDYEGFVLNIDDFIKSIDLLNTSNKWLSTECLLVMKQLALEAKELDLELKIVRG